MKDLRTRDQEMRLFLRDLMIERLNKELTVVDGSYMERLIRRSVKCYIGHCDCHGKEITLSDCRDYVNKQLMSDPKVFS